MHGTTNTNMEARMQLKTDSEHFIEASIQYQSNHLSRARSHSNKVIAKMERAFRIFDTLKPVLSTKCE